MKFENLDVIYSNQTTFHNLKQQGEITTVAKDCLGCNTEYTPIDEIRRPQKTVQLLNETNIPFAKTASDENGESFVSVNVQNMDKAYDLNEKSRCCNCLHAIRSY